jgi:hypothetical protein
MTGTLARAESPFVNAAGVERAVTPVCESREEYAGAAAFLGPDDVFLGVRRFGAEFIDLGTGPGAQLVGCHRGGV